MKKLMIAFTLFFALPIAAQKIQVDRATDTGQRIVKCKYQSISGNYLSLSLCAETTTSQQVEYFLSLKIVTSKAVAIPEGGRILLKLTDDSIITLYAKEACSDRTGYLEVSHTPQFSSYYFVVKPVYKITQEQIELISRDVVKIRIETEDEIVDRELRKERLGSVVEGQYNLIKEELLVEKDFADGF